MGFTRHLQVGAFIAVCSCSLFAQAKLDLKGSPIMDELLVEILNDSAVQEIKPDPPHIQNYFLRLYSIGELGICAPEVETEVTCSFRYYLAVSDGSLGVKGAVYFLGEVGEIRRIEWLSRDFGGPAKIRVEVGNFPKHALEVNPALALHTRLYELEVDLQAIKIKPIE